MTTTKQFTAPDIQNRKGQDKLVMLTAYDYTLAALLDVHVDMLLVGDSLGCVVQGHSNTLSVTLEETIYHARMVSRATQHALVIGDLPFGTYQMSSQQGLESALRLVKEAGVGAVKFEGGRTMCETITCIVNAGIPVMAHIGLTPQSFHALGGNRVQGKQQEQAEALIADAKAVAAAGAFALLLEAMPAPLAQQITKAVSIPTIGIGAGGGCDGQVLVTYDMLGFNQSGVPMKFNKEYCQLRDTINAAVQSFTQEVRAGMFPDRAHSYGLKQVSQLPF